MIVTLGSLTWGSATLAATLLLPLTAPATGPGQLPAGAPAAVRTAATIDVQGEVGQSRAVVTVTRLSRTAPVTVTWGDGSTTRLTTACTPAQAARGPVAACRARTQHVFTTDGSYRVTVERGPRMLAQRMVTVTAADPSSPSPSPTPTPTPSPTADTSTAAWQQDMLVRLNAFRAEVGAAPLALCSRLSTAAGDYARVMADNNHFSHTGPDGSSPGDRIAAAGYGSNVTWGENIAAGYPDVAQVMTGWRDSPGHYANMINGRFTHVGFGRAENAGSGYRIYWVQNFGAGGTC